MKLRTIVIPAAAAAALVLACQQSAHAGALVTVTDANLSGAAGTTVGWGFTASSDSQYMTVVNVEMLPSPSIGTFSDLLGIRPTFEVGPSPSPAASVTEAFDVGLGTGIGSFAINAGTPTGTVAFATLYVVYNLYNVSPNYDPTFDPFNPAHTFSEGNVLEIPVSVTVTAATATPEPSTWALVAAGCGALWMRRRQGCDSRI